MNMSLKNRECTEKGEKGLSEPCKMQKTHKEENQKCDKTAAAVFKAGFEICEGISGRREGTIGNAARKTTCDRESIRAAEIHV